MMGGMMCSLDTLSTVLGMPKTWLRDEANGGRLPCLMIGNRRYFDADLVREALADRARASTRQTQVPTDEG